MSRKPYVNELVPTVSIDRILNNVHAATPDAEVRENIEARMVNQTDPRWTPAIREQTIRYALWRHHENFRFYADVMHGRRAR